MKDQGNGADVIYLDLFKGLGLENQDLTKYDSLLVSFDERVVIPQGQISFPVSIEGKEVIVTFIVVNSFSPYTAILGRPWIHAMGAILLTLHMKVKFHTERGVAIMRRNLRVAWQCLVIAAHWKDEQTEHKEITEETPLSQLQKHRGEKGATGAEELEKVKILPDADRYFQVGSSMKEGDKIKMLLFLIQNVDVFA